MAEQPDSFKEQFDNQLTCTVCLDQYTDPKVLPCIHSFYLKCIQLDTTNTNNNKGNHTHTHTHTSLAVPPLCLERKGLGKAVYTTRTKGMQLRHRMHAHHATCSHVRPHANTCVNSDK